MNFEPKDKFYCATCKKEIELNSELIWSTTKSGTLKVHHKKCPGQTNNQSE